MKMKTGRLIVIKREIPIMLRHMGFAIVLAAIFLAVTPPPAEARVSTESVGYYEEAKGFLKKGNIKSAIIQLKNAIRADGDNVQARYDLAIIYLRGRDGPSAEKELRVARDRGMEAAKVILPLAQAYNLQSKNKKLTFDQHHMG